MLMPVDEPDAVALRRFVVTLPLAIGTLGGIIAWQTGAWLWGLPLWVAAVVVGLVGALMPRTRRSIWHGFMVVTRPIGWLVSMVLLAVVYFIVVLPMALALRALRGDRLGLRFNREASTHWEQAEVEGGVERRFRPF